MQQPLSLSVVGAKVTSRSISWMESPSSSCLVATQHWEPYRSFITNAESPSENTSCCCTYESPPWAALAIHSQEPRRQCKTSLSAAAPSHSALWRAAAAASMGLLATCPARVPMACSTSACGCFSTSAAAAKRDAESAVAAAAAMTAGSRLASVAAASKQRSSRRRGEAGGGAKITGEVGAASASVGALGATSADTRPTLTTPGSPELTVGNDSVKEPVSMPRAGRTTKLAPSGTTSVGPTCIMAPPGPMGRDSATLLGGCAPAIVTRTPPKQALGLRSKEALVSRWAKEYQ